MRTPRLKVGLLGAGYIADWHVKALAGLKKRTELVSVCDVNRARAEDFGRRHGLASYGSIDEWLQRDKPDAVHVLVPPEHHFAAAKQLLEAGVHVLLEKPACVSVEECDQLLEAAKKSAAKVGVSHNFLFSPVYEKLRQDVRDHKLGPILEADIVWNKELGQLRGGPFGAFMFRQPGNIMLEIGPHSIGHLLDLVGEPDSCEVECDRSVTLSNGQAFHRRWQVRTKKGESRTLLNFDMAPGVTEHRITLRGLIGTATGDFEAGTYVLRRNSPLPDDFDRYAITREEAKQLRRQSRGKLMRYGLSKFKLSKRGNDFGASILQSLKSFYRELPNEPEERLSLKFARKIVEWGARIGAAAPAPAPVIQVAKPIPKPAEVLILGGTGFIGQALIRQLEKAGQGIRVLARDPGNLPKSLRDLPIEVVKGDVANIDSLRKAMEGISTVCHLARAHVKTWDDYVRQEIDATRHIAEVVLQAKVKRFLYTGTIDSYYTANAGETIHDDTPLDPEIQKRNLYAKAKAISENTLTEMARNRGLPLAILRPGIVIGSGGSPFHWGVGMWNGMSVCQVWGWGETYLPLVLVEDVAMALATATTADGVIGKTFNLVGEPQLTAREYLDALQQAAGVSLDIRYTPSWKFFQGDLFKYMVKLAVQHPERKLPSFRDWDTRSHRARFDCANAKAILGWKPVNDRQRLIEEGIALPAKEWLA